MQILRAMTLNSVDDPFDVGPEIATQLHCDGAVCIENGQIKDVGPYDRIAKTYPNSPVQHYPNHLICAGFIDAHVHYPQTGMIASWGKRLIDWLNSYTFPEEMKFNDPAYAKTVAGRYLDLALDHGTTTVASFCTIHTESVDAIFQAAQSRNMRIVAGKTCMDRNAPDKLRDTAQLAFDDSNTLIHRWHGIARGTYAITPRFSPTSTPDQLAALGALWAEHPSCLMQTHISEQTDEVEWVARLFPNVRDYLDTYETYGLLGSRGIYGHAIHLEPREIDRLAEVAPTLTFDVVEKSWGKRHLMRTPMDLQGEPSRDTGASLKGPITGNGQLSYRIMAGSGAEFGAESGDGRKYMAALNWRIDDRWMVDVYVDTEKLAGRRDRNTLQGFVEYDAQRWRLGVLYSNQDRQDDPPLELASAWWIGSLGERSEFIARVDRIIEPSPRGDNISYIPFDPTAPATMFYTGIELALSEHVSLTPNIIVTSYDRAEDGTRPETDLYLRLTAFVNFE